jgi:GNAT superfamily N-acetyltransferase
LLDISDDVYNLLSKVKSEYIPLLIPIMKASFNEDTKMHTELLEDGPCGYDTGELLEKLLIKNNSVSRIILCDSKVIGEYTISEKNSVYTLEMLFIDPQYVSKGIGFIVWNDIENENRNAKSWMVETPDYSIRNHRFYEKCGFKMIKEFVYSDNAKSYIFVKYVKN